MRLRKGGEKRETLEEEMLHEEGTEGGEGRAVMEQRKRGRR